MAKGRELTALKGTTRMDSSEVHPVQASNLIAGIIRESRVDVEFHEEPRRIRVKVHSIVRQGLFRWTDVMVAGNSQHQMQAKVGIAAGTLAEQLCALYDDKVEPSECARKAGQHYRELCEFLTRPGAQADHAVQPDDME